MEENINLPGSIPNFFHSFLKLLIVKSENSGNHKTLPGTLESNLIHNLNILGVIFPLLLKQQNTKPVAGNPWDSRVKNLLLTGSFSTLG